MNEQPVTIDSLLPPAMASKAEDLGVKKANLATRNMFMLAILAGAFIAVGAIFATTVLSGTSALPWGVQRLIGGTAFTLGLIMVVVGGAELFTGNNLVIMAYASGKIPLSALLNNWVIVYIGNLVGSLLTAVIMFLTMQYTFANGAVGLTALNIANGKVNLQFVQAIALGIMCNALVCMAVWMTYSARSTTDRILAIIPPIAAFVAAGFEHSIANMYFIPVGLLIKDFGGESLWKLQAMVDAGKTAESYASLTWGSFFINNLLPVTIGNIIGGAVMVGLIYWLVYLRKTVSAPVGEPPIGQPVSQGK